MSGAEQIAVSLGERSYNIVIGPGTLRDAGKLIRAYKSNARIFVITDTHVGPLYAATLQASVEESGYRSQRIEVPPGEASKSFSQIEAVTRALVAAGLQRGDMIVALGGGVVGDLAGFASAIALRGIDYIQIPTTLLAQVDSSVGGKTGINIPEGKNLVGAFHQPRLVLIDTDCLDTLDSRQLRAGYAEIMKIALIGNSDFFRFLETHGGEVLKPTGQRLQAIVTACRMKAEIVMCDEREGGERMLLNLGHTFGHALEAVTGYGERLLHGEAVAIGTVLAFRLSTQLGYCAPEEAKRVEDQFQAMGLPVSAAKFLPNGVTSSTIVSLMNRDKKVSGDLLTLILVSGIGKAFVARNIPSATIGTFLDSELK